MKESLTISNLLILQKTI